MTLARIVTLYAPDAMFFGFLLTVVPFQLRLEGGGAALSAAVSWIALPLGFAFLWAPFVDGRSLFGLGRRSGWASVCQVSAGLAFAGTALAFQLMPERAGPMAALLPSLIAAFLFATRNIALNAWIRESVPMSDVAIAVGVRCGGAAVGNWLGAGALSGRFEMIGWSGAFWALAGATLMSAVALWRLPGQSRQPATEDAVGLAATISGMRDRPGVVRRALSVATLSAVMAPPAALGVVVFADKGFTSEQLSYATGYAGAAAAALGAFAGGKLARMFGLGPMLVAAAFAQGALCLAWAAFAASSAEGLYPVGLSLTAAQYGLFAMMASLWLTAVIQIASRERAATELALLNALLLLAGTFAPTLAGTFADLAGSVPLTLVALAALASATALLAPTVAGRS
ncbi:hypothetical protein ACFQ4O_01995 [Methylopila musalis]|uniref:Major Facilitator Superfamily protein n=1 Tax=Methylopila musalis TaxID=1134781 RepID=A0ABW3Z3B7_9HYPH